MPDVEVDIMKRWGEPQLAQTALHERIFGGARIDHGNHHLVVAGDELPVGVISTELKQQRC